MSDIYVKTLEIAGFYPVLKAMRLPMKSGDKSDSYFPYSPSIPQIATWTDLNTNNIKKIQLDYPNHFAEIGPKDLQLLQNLIRSGDEHGKVSRGIVVWFEVNMPRYFHVELDTYKIGAERLGSESTMHCECKKLTGKELQEAKGKIEESHLQTRIWDMSYQTLRRMYFQRRNHRLPEWRIICDWIESLPLAKELITINPWYVDKINELELENKYLKEKLDTTPIIDLIKIKKEK